MSISRPAAKISHSIQARVLFVLFAILALNTQASFAQSPDRQQLLEEIKKYHIQLFMLARCGVDCNGVQLVQIKDTYSYYVDFGRYGPQIEDRLAIIFKIMSTYEKSELSGLGSLRRVMAPDNAELVFRLVEQGKAGVEQYGPNGCATAKGGPKFSTSGQRIFELPVWGIPAEIAAGGKSPLSMRPRRSERHF